MNATCESSVRDSAKQRLRVGVLMGGRSIEHEVSFNSGRTICDHLDATIYDVLPIYQTQSGELYILPYRFLHRGKTSDFSSKLSTTDDAKKITYDDIKELVDFLYLAIHGRYAEDGTIQGMLEVLGIPYLGSDSFSCTLSMDKSRQKDFLKVFNIESPKGICLDSNDIKFIINSGDLNTVLDRLKSVGLLTPPFIVKPSCEGSSLGITAVFSKEDLLEAIKKAAYCDPKRIQSVLIEEKLEGMEFVCTHIEEENQDQTINNNTWLSLPITEIVPENNTHFFDYEQKYMPGRATKIVPARCSIEDTRKIQDACLQATKALGFSTISRVDGFLTVDGRIVITDSNAISGTAPSSFVFHQAAQIGMSHTDLINHLIKIDLINLGMDKEHLNLKSRDKKDDMSKIQKAKIRVGVLLGGEANEREISLESGRNVSYKLAPNKYDVSSIFVNEKMELFNIPQKLLVKNSTKEISEALDPDMQIKWSDLPNQFDFIFIALHGGKGENGNVQGALEMLDLPYNGSGIFASSLCMDKYRANDFLKQNGFDVPESKLVTNEQWSSLNNEDEKNKYIQAISESIRFPLIVKPHDDGCSFFVKKIESKKDLIVALDDYFKTGKSTAMIEEYIDAFELTCGVLGNDDPVALPPSQPIVGKEILSIEEKFLPGAGENQTPANLPKDKLEFVISTMQEVYKCIGCSGYARIDCFYQEAAKSKTGKDRVIILEINTLPGLTPATCIFHQAAEIGIKPMEFIDKIVDFGIKRHTENLIENDN